MEDWLNEGYLKQHKSSRKEIGQLFDVYRRDIADARLRGLSVERQFESAYNAGLVMAKAALAASGYRTSGDGREPAYPCNKLA